MIEIFSPHEIATSLYDSKVLDKGTADRLEQRITAWADSQRAEGKREGQRETIVKAVRKANFVVSRIKSPTQRAAAEKVVQAVERLLPDGVKEAYARGYTDGATDRFRKAGTKPKENG